MPIFFSHIKPDLYFVGFDVTAALAKGSSTPSATNPGWFICFEEGAGEIVFGADETDLSKIASNFSSTRLINRWDELQWGHFLMNNNETKFIDSNSIINVNPINNQDGILWGTNAADMAYALYQKPSRVFIHSNDMLN